MFRKRSALAWAGAWLCLRMNVWHSLWHREQVENLSALYHLPFAVLFFLNGEFPDWIYWEPTKIIIGMLNKVAHFLVRPNYSFYYIEWSQICFYVIATHWSWFVFLKQHERALFLFYIIALVYLTFSMIHRGPW